MLRPALIALCAPLLPAAVAPPADVVVKLATIVPEGSVWDKAFREMGAEWQRDTDGRVRMQIYPGGVAGDEPDIVRKVRLGQLGAAALTVTGLGAIDDAFRFFEIPLFFESDEEVYHIAQSMAPVLEQRLEQKGFVLLSWGPAGWIHLFSKEPVRKLDDLKRLKQFVWAGDNHMTQWWKESGFRPVPLAATDIMMGLRTGLIEAVPSPPYAALAFQWFRETPYMLDFAVVPYIGGTVMSKRVWSKLSEPDRAAVLAAARRAEARLREEVPRQEHEAIEEMKRRGLTVVGLDEDVAVWRAAADGFAQRMREVVPADFFDQAVRARDEFRRQRRQAAGQDAGDGR